jgi:tRNA modification GTPase
LIEEAARKPIGWVDRFARLANDRCDAALWTPRGRGAIATIRVRGDVRQWLPTRSLPFQAANGRGLDGQPLGRVVFGRWGGDPAEHAVLCVLDEQTLEIHCHGGDAAAARILDDLAQTGCRVVAWQEMVGIAEGPIEAELLEALSRATTLRTAAILLEQSNGILRATLESLESDTDLRSLDRRIKALLCWADFGVHLTRPWKVVLAGRPNVGKSSLINALLGYARSIVFDQPGTTRDVVTGTTAVDGWPIELLDTAGLREKSEPLEAAGIERARGALAVADLTIVLIDVSAPATDDDRMLLSTFHQAIVVGHKCDLAPFHGKDRWDDEVARGWLPVSSKTSEGVDALIRAISTRLAPAVPSVGTPIPVTVRQTSLLRRASEAAERGDLSECRQMLAQILR